MGRVVSVSQNSFRLDIAAALYPGDGLCFFDDTYTLCGVMVNAVQGPVITPNDITTIKKGMLIYRNHDHEFLKRLDKSRVERKIAVYLTLTVTPDGFHLTAVDEDGNTVQANLVTTKVKADKPDKMLATINKQLRQMGDTEFVCTGLEVVWPEVCFLPLSVLNALRREVLANLSATRMRQRPVRQGSILRNDAPYPEKTLSYLGNVLNQQAVAFYRRHGVTKIEPAAESGLELTDRPVMRTKYCLKHQLGWCPRDQRPPALAEPLYLVDEAGHKYELHNDCAACEMEVLY